MSSQSENAPDLNSILRTLSAFSSQTNTHQLASNNHAANDHENDYEPPDAHLPPVVVESQTQPQPTSGKTHPHPSSYSSLSSSSSSSLRYSPQANQSSKPQPQTKEKNISSTITTWSVALKQVMRTVAQNEDIQRRIRFLIQRQHDHEKQWWKGREALLQKQTSRKQKKMELDQVLRSVGAPVDEKEVSTAEEDSAEINNYDAKVHKASRQMADAMLSELKALDVPFFCTSQSLIADETARQKEELTSHPSSPGGVPGTPGKQSRLSIDELSALQRRMLELLQDLCRE
ncbi:hypothetical protein BJX76DRAFT_336672 [Aspergillus varians]